MTQNTSHAVMAQRIEALDSLDDFPTPGFATRALCEHVIPKGYLGGSVREPAANRGFMVRALKPYFESVIASDIFDYGEGFPVADFLKPEPHSYTEKLDWMITNPPFNKAAEFVKRACGVSNFGVAVLVRASWLEGNNRFNNLFKVNRPSIVAQFVERVPMLKGRCVSHVIDPKTGKLKRATTATAYCWVVWIDGYHATARTDFVHIPPCRARLERPGDYQEVSI